MKFEYNHLLFFKYDISKLILLKNYHKSWPALLRRFRRERVNVSFIGGACLGTRSSSLGGRLEDMGATPPPNAITVL